MIASACERRRALVAGKRENLKKKKRKKSLRMQNRRDVPARTFCSFGKAEEFDVVRPALRTIQSNRCHSPTISLLSNGRYTMTFHVLPFEKKGHVVTNRFEPSFSFSFNFHGS